MADQHQKLKPEASGWWQGMVEKYGWKKPMTPPSPAPRPQAREETRAPAAVQLSRVHRAPPPDSHVTEMPQNPSDRAHLRVVRTGPGEDDWKYVRRDNGSSQPPVPPIRRRSGGSGGDGQQPSTSPVQEKEHNMATQAGTQNSGSGLSNNWIAGIVISGCLLSTLGWMISDKMKNDYKNSPAGMAEKKLAQTKADTEKAAVTTPGASVSIWGASGAPAAEPATTSSPAATAQQEQSSVKSSYGNSSSSASLPVIKCGGRADTINIGAGETRSADGGADGGCIGVYLTGPVTFRGQNYVLFKEGNYDDHVSDLDGHGPDTVQTWLRNHANQNIVVIIKTHNSNYGWIRFNPQE